MAKIAVLGTGDVGQRIGTKLVQLGHEVRLGSRSATNEKALAWAKEVGERGAPATFADAAAFADELVFFCVSGAATKDVLAAASGALKGKVLVDLSNPLDFSKGFPPSLSVCNTSSLGEEIQAELPDVRVVKTLNMVANPVMVNPGALPEATDLLLCGNDAGAKAKVTELLRSFGWERVTDLGDMTNARGLEAWLLLWTRLYGKLGTGMFNIRIVRE
jgi:predicted dinucleotide-binding enzyme